MDRNRRFAGLTGICWHKARDPIMSDVGGKVCGKCGERFEDNPDYAADPCEVLKVMIAREDWPEFQKNIGDVERTIIEGDGRKTLVNPTIRIDYITDETGKLRDAAIKFLEEEAKT